MSLSVVQRDAAGSVVAACDGEARHPHRGGSGGVFGLHLHHCHLLLSGPEERTSADQSSRSETLHQLVLNQCTELPDVFKTNPRVLDSSEEPGRPRAARRAPSCRKSLRKQVKVAPGPKKGLALGRFTAWLMERDTKKPCDLCRAFEDDDCVAVIEQSPNTSDTRARPPGPSLVTVQLEPTSEDGQPAVDGHSVTVETYPEPILDTKV